MCSALSISGCSFISFQLLFYELYYLLFLLLQILVIYFSLPGLTNLKINFLQFLQQSFPQIKVSY